jgi:hypothetical protein
MKRFSAAWSPPVVDMPRKETPRPHARRDRRTDRGYAMTASTIVCMTPAADDAVMPGAENLHARQAQIRALVHRRLGEQHACLLAEPQRRAGEDRITWLSAAAGLVRPLAALPAATRASVREECDALLAEIDRLGESLESGAAGDGRLAGRLLRLVARRAPDDCLFLVGNQPVLVGWGCPPTETLRPAASATATTEAPPATANPGARWLVASAEPPAATQSQLAGQSEAMAALHAAAEIGTPPMPATLP